MPIVEHEVHIPLEKESKIWRYIDFEKYESLLKEKSLFFCRADKFSDPFEGSLPKREAEYRKSEERHSAKFNNIPFDEELAKKNIEALGELHKKLKRATVINCWHINDNESDAMWQLYLKNNEGVAIQSNKERIYSAFFNTIGNIGASKVRYLNYENGIWHHPVDYPHHFYNTVTPLIHKRIEFVHENEFRLYHHIYEAENNKEYWDTKKNSLGEFIEVDISILVERIILSPTSDENFEKKVKDLAIKYGFEFQFYKSKLQSNPYY